MTLRWVISTRHNRLCMSQGSSDIIGEERCAREPEDKAAL